MFSSVLSICPFVSVFLMIPVCSQLFAVLYSLSLYTAGLHITMIIHICPLSPPILIIGLHIMWRK